MAGTPDGPVPAATGPHHPAPLLLTGAAGFLGLRLASDLLARGVPLLLPVRAGSDRQAAERVVRRAQSAGLPLTGAGFQVIAADVVVVDVDAVGGSLSKQLGNRAVVVVEGGVKTEVAQPGNLRVSTSRTDNPRSTEQPR